MVRWRASRPVFLDRTGRRRRFLLLAGVALGVVLLLSLGVLALGAVGGGSVPLPRWPDSGGGARAGQEPTSIPSPRTPVSSPGAPTRAGQPAGSPSPGVTTPDRPGQGDEHRRTAKPTRSPGKPR